MYENKHRFVLICFPFLLSFAFPPLFSHLFLFFPSPSFSLIKPTLSWTPQILFRHRCSISPRPAPHGDILGEGMYVQIVIQRHEIHTWGAFICPTQSFDGMLQQPPDSLYSPPSTHGNLSWGLDKALFSFLGLLQQATINLVA